MTDENRPQDPDVTPFVNFSLATTIARELRDDPAYDTGKNARTLVRSTDLTLVLIALREGKELKPHHAAGPATAIVLEGEVLFRALGDKPSDVLLKAHDCAVFSGDLQHSVEARTEALLLIVMGKKETSPS